MRRSVGLAMAAAMVVVALLAPAAEAKGPLRIVLSGGDLDASVTLDGPIDGRDMYGDGVAMDAPLPFPEHIYTVEAYPAGAEEGTPPQTIYYYPGHDGLPSAFRMRYGFFAVTDEFDAVLRGHLPAREADGGNSLLWFVIPGVAVGLASVGGVALHMARPRGSRGAT